MNNADGWGLVVWLERPLCPKTSDCVSGMGGAGPPNKTSTALKAAAIDNAATKMVDFRVDFSMREPPRLMMGPPCLACGYRPAEWGQADAPKPTDPHQWV